MGKTVKILVLATNPDKTEPLRLDAEVRGIDQALQQSRFRDKFELEQQWAVRVSDLQRLLLRYKPDIVHFRDMAANPARSYLKTVRETANLFQLPR